VEKRLKERLSEREGETDKLMEQQAKEIERLRRQVEELNESQKRMLEKAEKEGGREAIIDEIKLYVDKLLEDPKYAERALKESKKASG